MDVQRLKSTLDKGFEELPFSVGELAPEHFGELLMEEAV